MLNKITILFFCLFSLSCFASISVCPSALPTTHSGFCASFVSAASCYCSNSLPKKMCEDMNLIYQRMMGMFGSIENACKFQRETPPQTCIDDWSCYLKGGKDSHGGLCSGTGKSCV